MAREVVRRLVAADAGGAAAGDPCRVPVGRADPQRAVAPEHAPARRQPVGQPDVVRMHVGHDHAQHRQAAQVVCEHLLPGGAGGVVADAAVDDGPAFHRAVRALDPVAQEPEVDVVQREGAAASAPISRRGRHRGCCPAPAGRRRTDRPSWCSSAFIAGRARRAAVKSGGTLTQTPGQVGRRRVTGRLRKLEENEEPTHDHRPERAVRQQPRVGQADRGARTRLLLAAAQAAVAAVPVDRLCRQPGAGQRPGRPAARRAVRAPQTSPTWWCIPTSTACRSCSSRSTC